MMIERKFIRLTDGHGSPLYVAMDAIEAMGFAAEKGTGRRSGGWVDTTGGRTYFVRQTPDEILQAADDESKEAN